MPQREDFRDRVCRLVRPDRSPVGSAFGIGPRVALTCHHCVAGCQADGLRLLVHALGAAEPLLLDINDILLPQQPASTDLAILLLADDLPAWLAITTEAPPRYANPVGYGFPGERAQQAAVRVHLDSRGIQQASYSGKSLRYALQEALVLAGDPASGGMSGGPVMDDTAGVVVAMIVGGPEYDGRTIAMPFHGVDPACDWASYQFAIQWNSRSSVHRGWAMNLQAAREICSRQTQEAVRRQHTFDVERYVPRQQALAAHARFMAGGQAALMVLGMPNIGKSTLLAALAMQGAQRSLYFDAFKLADTRVPLLDAIHGTLPPEARDEAGSMERLAQVLAAGGTPLVVYLDAINEMDEEPRRISNWLDDAIGECTALDIKLVVSCRSDAWSGFDVRGNVAELTLDGFSDEEAATALARYGVAAPPAHELARHPLFFRIASSMAGHEQRMDEGWYGVIHAFVRHLVRSAPGMRASRVAGIVNGVERIASSLGMETENIPWEFAAIQLGGGAELDALVSAGLFKTRDGRTVRFAFDELTEALRPPLDCSDSDFIALWQQALADDATRRRLTGSILRAYSLHDETSLSRHIDTLRIAGGTLGQLLPAHLVQLGSLVAAIDAGLPEQASEWVDRLFDIYLSCASEMAAQFKGLPHFIESRLAQAPLRAKYKIALLAAMLPYCSDTKLRMKDLEDRGTLDDLLQDAAEQRTIAGALLRLAQDHTLEARPHLLPLLADDRPLRMGDGEVTVGQIVSFILRITARCDLAGLVARLLEEPSDARRMRLLNDVARRYPTDSLLCALEYLDGAAAIAAMDSIIVSSLQTMGPGRAPRAVIARLQRIIDEGTPPSRVRAASLVRIAAPDDLAAWDILHEAVIGGAELSLRPVPRARIDAFLDALARRDSAAAIDEIHDEDDVALQARLASIAEQVLARHGAFLGRKLGHLAEHKLYGLARHEGYRPWLAFAIQLLRAGIAGAAEPLMYFAYPQTAPDPDRKAIWDAAMQAGNADIIKTWVEFSLKRVGEAPGGLGAAYLASAAAADFAGTLQCLADAAAQAKFLFENYDDQPEQALLDLLAGFMQEVRQRPALASQLPPPLAAWQAGQPLVDLFAGLVNAPTS